MSRPQTDPTKFNDIELKTKIRQVGDAYYYYDDVRQTWRVEASKATELRVAKRVEKRLKAENNNLREYITRHGLDADAIANEGTPFN